MRSLAERSLSLALVMSSSHKDPRWLAKAAAEGSDNGDQEAIPQLPESSDEPDIPSLRLGETIRFEEWGPIILNTDGTTRRIANWDSLTEQEKAVTWRRVSKRNEERRLALLEQMKQQQESDGKEEL